MKILYITSLSGRRINGFMRSAILAAKTVGYEFVLACNSSDADVEGYAKDCVEYGIRMKHIDFDRNPLSKSNIKAYQQLCQLMQSEHFDIVHCNTPIGGVLGRLCAKRAGINYVIYQAHGFHFWKGAPLKNWLVYYPVERYLAHYTDLLITINNEDYARAQGFHLRKNGKVVKVPGVGVDTARFNEIDNTEKTLLTRQQLRKSWGIPLDATVFLSVGELNANKNHEIGIKAFASANIPNSYYLICGAGGLKDELSRLAECLGKEKEVRLLGFQSNIPEILVASDCFVFTSWREGLPGALMEAMAAGLPCIASRIRGCTDLLGDNGFLFDPNDSGALAALMQQMTADCLRKKEGEKNRSVVRKYDIHEAVRSYKDIYADIGRAYNKKENQQ